MKKHTFKDSFKGWKILWKYLAVYRKELYFLSVLGIFSALANGSVPYIAGKFFDAILKPEATLEYAGITVALWTFFLSLWASAQMVAILTDWVNDRNQVKFGDRVLIDYRVHAAHKLLLLPLSFYKNRKHGEVMESIGRAGQSMYQLIANVIIRLTPQFLSIFIGFFFVFSMNVKLALILVVGILSYIFVLVRTVPATVPLEREYHEKWRKGFGRVTQAMNNIATVKQSGTENYEKDKIKGLYMKGFRTGIVLENIWSNLSLSQRSIVVGTQLLIFVSSVYSIHAGILTLGELLAFNGYAMMVFTPFVALGQNWKALQSGLVTLENAERILTEKEEVYMPAQGIKSFDFKGAIKFDNVSFGYKKDQKVLDGVTFETHPGQMVALVGESGAGKSTLIDLISGYYFPLAGKITIDGHPTKKINLTFLRKHVALVPQEVVLFHEDIRSNIAYGNLSATDEEIEKAVKVAHADQFIEKFPKKYKTVVGERGVKLSVGQKQRIAIARAVLRDPKILILDEPTSALDSETEKYVTEALDEVMKGRTTFVIAHRLSTVRKADKILVLEKGKIVEQGTHEELMKIEGGNYRRRYELHIGLE